MSKCLATQGVRCDFNHPLDSQHAELMKKYVEKFDYTEWRKNLFAGMSATEISKRAMEFQKEQEK